MAFFFFGPKILGFNLEEAVEPGGPVSTSPNEGTFEKIH
jgi:hypothetical protein